jgi:hypothetical protein
MFGRNPEKAEAKAAAEAATQAEAAKLMSMPLDDLAAQCFGAFGPDGPSNAKSGMGSLTVANWLIGRLLGGTSHVKELVPRVREAMQRLEVAGLILLRMQNEVGSRAYLTDAGIAALRDGTAADYLSGKLRP